MSDANPENTGMQRFVEAGAATRFQAGNPGRPKGARNKLGEAFIEALHDDFAKHGVATIEAVRTEKPDQYLKVIASLMPKDVTLTLNDNVDDLTDDELIERVRRLAAAIAPLLDGGTGADQIASGEAPSTQEPSRVH